MTVSAIFNGEIWAVDGEPTGDGRFKAKLKPGPGRPSLLKLWSETPEGAKALLEAEKAKVAKPAKTPKAKAKAAK